MAQYGYYYMIRYIILLNYYKYNIIIKYTYIPYIPYNTYR
nr:MAG TPA: hypothetical protein [Caudoviricetes sp.]